MRLLPLIHAFKIESSVMASVYGEILAEAERRNGDVLSAARVLVSFVRLVCPFDAGRLVHREDH